MSTLHNEPASLPPDVKDPVNEGSIPTGSLSLQAFEERVGAIETLPALPLILTQLMACLEQPPTEIDFDQVVRLVSRDESVAEQCIRMTNSAIFGRRRLG